MSNSNRIIAAIVDKTPLRKGVNTVKFYSQNGHMTTVSHDNVINTSVSGNRIVIISENKQGNHNGNQYVYDADSYMMIDVIPW